MSSSAADLLDDYPVVTSFPVAWGDMDAFQHVNNTRYFRYFEDARIAYFEEAGISAATGMPEGIGPILASTSCRFKAPLSFPDHIAVGARITDLEEDRFTVEHAIASEQFDRVAATGHALVVAFDYQKQRKAAVPEAWRRAIERLQG
ncbi:MAG: acyl-CoA thioesterase [Persicimonas sp.]